jgi:hypothetical protein
VLILTLKQASRVAEKRNQRMLELKAELKHWMKDLQHAQSDLKKLRAIGADESAIRRVMLLMGFANVTPDEFLAASTKEHLGRLITKIGRPQSN